MKPQKVEGLYTGFRPGKTKRFCTAGEGRRRLDEWRLTASFYAPKSRRTRNFSIAELSRINLLEISRPNDYLICARA